MEDKCFECETTEDLHQHHVVPRSRGGTKTVTLCHSCHMKAHGRDSKGLNHSRMVKEGLARAKAKGVKIGNPNITEARLKANQACRAKGQATRERYIGLINDYRLQGFSAAAIAKEFNKIGLKTPRGGKWRHSSIIVIERRNNGRES